MKRTLTIPTASYLDLLRRHSPLAAAAHVRGNAAGLHGGRKPKYGKRGRQRGRVERRREGEAWQ